MNAKSKMTPERGFFRLWIAVALIWIFASVWLLRGNLTADCNHVLRFENDITAVVNCRLEKIAASSSRWPLRMQISAAGWVVIPPLGVLAIGFIGFWVLRGFPLD